MYSIAQAGQDSLVSASSSESVKRKIDEPLMSSDFSAVAIQYFPVGSAGEAPSFTWKDYTPRVFQRLRSLFGIDNADYLVSLTGGPALRELASPGASGCIFFLSSDDRFMIKSVRKEEMELLLGLVKRYHAHIAAQPNTFLVRFLGVHRISPWLGRNARFLVMGNVLPTDRRMHRKYDLKGSTYKRTIAADAEFLEKLHVMDYSLLLGVHFLRWGNEEWYPPFSDWPTENSNPEAAEVNVAAGGSPTAASISQQDEQSPQQPLIQQLPSFPPVNRKPKRTGSMAVGESLVDTLESLSTAGVLEPALSRTAASVVATANSSRLAARVLAAEAQSHRPPSRVRQPWMEEKHRVPDFNTVSSMAMISTPASPMTLNFSDTTPAGAFAGSGGGNAGLNTFSLASAATLTNSPSSNKKKLSSSLVGGDEQRGNGWAVPAFAVRTTTSGVVVREPVLLYFGIIDFLQKYNTRKRVEHAWKTSLHGSSVSVADPRHYSKRFLKFLDELFVVAAS
ncbi:hypothetical protein Ndes2437A_g09168 [Nannochloris sp. 'desiccata']